MGMLVRHRGRPSDRRASWACRCRAVVEMADLEDGVNTVTAYGADGFGQPLPLQLRAGEERASGVPGERRGAEVERPARACSCGCRETVARYFTRNIVDIELTQRGRGARGAGRGARATATRSRRPQLLRRMRVQGRGRDHVRGRGRRSGQPHRRNGVLLRRTEPPGRACATDGATADKWVNWQFTTTFEDAGDYRMTVRAKTADGEVSPLAATLLFEVA